MAESCDHPMYRVAAALTCCAANSCSMSRSALPTAWRKTPMKRSAVQSNSSSPGRTTLATSASLASSTAAAARAAASSAAFCAAAAAAAAVAAAIDGAPGSPDGVLDSAPELDFSFFDEDGLPDPLPPFASLAASFPLSLSGGFASSGRDAAEGGWESAASTSGVGASTGPVAGGDSGGSRGLRER